MQILPVYMGLRRQLRLVKGCFERLNLQTAVIKKHTGSKKAVISNPGSQGALS